MTRITPVILAGGVGSRLWPMSREDRPKQFLPLVSQRSMLQDTLLRLSEPTLFKPPVVVCHARYAEIVRAQAAEIGADLSAVILEPMAKNSAPAVAAAMAYLGRTDERALAMISPADHVIADAPAFYAAVGAAADLAGAGRLATFGIAPERPETGFGYIKAGAPIEGSAGRAVAAFVEKPDLATAEAYVASGDYSWNSGMFLFRASDIAAELQTFEPALAAAVSAALAAARREQVGGVLEIALEAAAFDGAPSISIDYAVMERTARAAVVTGRFGWSDIGAWDALADKLPTDADGNTLIGDVAAIDAANVYARSDGPFLAVIGLEDVAVVATGDAVLVCRKDQAQKVKDAFNRHKARG